MIKFPADLVCGKKKVVVKWNKEWLVIIKYRHYTRSYENI